MEVLITDFDGVICDSASEGFLSAYNAYLKIEKPEAPRVLDIRRLSGILHQDFRRLRSYLHGGDDFVPIVKAAIEGVNLNSQGDFDEYRKQFHDRLPLFQQTFYDERDYLRKNKKELWLSLNPLFPEASAAFRLLAPFHKVYILTTKRAQDVEDILSYWKIDFPPDQIFSVQTAEKYPRLLEIMELSGATGQEITYIEDQISFLPPALSHGMKVYLAGWGYVSPEQRETARQHGIPIIGKEEMESILEGIKKNTVPGTVESTGGPSQRQGESPAQ
jgi:phosphoglycolate phosphatase-like HAD superfamily hydrolase